MMNITFTNNIKITDLVMFERLGKGEVVPIIQYQDYSETTNKSIYLAKIKMSSDLKCFTIKTTETSLALDDYCVMNCKNNQIVDVNNNSCVSCPAGLYVKGNSCVNHCGDLSLSIDYCVNSDNIANKSYNLNTMYCVDSSSWSFCNKYQSNKEANNPSTSTSLNGYCINCDYFSGLENSLQCQSPASSPCSSSQQENCQGECVTKNTLTLSKNPITGACTECPFGQIYNVVTKECIVTGSCSDVDGVVLIMFVLVHFLPQNYS